MYIFFLERYPHGIFAAGGALVSTQEKKKKLIRKLENIMKVSKSHRMIASAQTHRCALPHTKTTASIKFHTETTASIRCPVKKIAPVKVKILSFNNNSYGLQKRQ